MNHSKFFPFKEASDQAQKASLRASTVRKRIRQQRLLAANIRHWKAVFSLANALFAVGIFIVLAIADSLLLGDMYREFSKMVCGDADHLRWEIAVVVNLIAALCSHEITRTLASGPFFDWEADKYASVMPGDIVQRQLSKIRAGRRLPLILMLLVFITMLSLILLMRADFMHAEGSTEMSETWIIVLGLCLMGFEIAAGCYFVYLIQYLFWVLLHSLQQARVRRGIRAVAKMDRSVHEYCMYLDPSIPLTSDMKEAIYRFRYRRHDLSYCDLMEYTAESPATLQGIPRLTDARGYN
ncbi:MAG: hypothetical protein JNM22_07615 [Saprospiraceae bacterium]|nr:hypothetical protein [Saprospiraceae bacterium]